MKSNKKIIEILDGTKIRKLTEEEQRSLLNEEIEFIEYDNIDKCFNFGYEKEILSIPIELTFNPYYAKKLLINILIEDEILNNEVIEVLK